MHVSEIDFGRPDGGGGIADSAAASSSPVSYAWSLPSRTRRRYRSRFLPMRWPDLVLDDWAFRRWRRSGGEEGSDGPEEGEVFV